jgi:hypothetical protein
LSQEKKKKRLSLEERVAIIKDRLTDLTAIITAMLTTTLLPLIIIILLLLITAIAVALLLR